MQTDLTGLFEILEEYDGVAGSAIAILQKTQELYGYLPKEALTLISREAGIPLTKLMGIATFYTQFRQKPAGKYLIMLCQGTACHVNGSEGIGEAIEEFLGVKPGETTADGLFMLESVACLGCCSLSPVMMINGEAYGNLTGERAKEILTGLARLEATQ